MPSSPRPILPHRVRFRASSSPSTPSGKVKRKRIAPLACALVFAIAVPTLCTPARAADGVTATLKVSVAAAPLVCEGVDALVCFDAPLEESMFSAEMVHYLVATDGDLRACQVTPIDSTATRGYRWARLKAVLPVSGGTYTLLATKAGVRPNVPLVGAVNLPYRTILDTVTTTLTFDPHVFSILRDAAAGEKTLVPIYDDRLKNTQQGAELVLTDIFRHADFTLVPEVEEGGFRFVEGGPAEASVGYKGRFTGDQSVPAVPFEAEVGLCANDVLRVAVVLEAKDLDLEAYKPGRLRMIVPLLFTQATRPTFGGAGESLRGMACWEGQSGLSVAADGSYVFSDAKGPEVTGKGPVTWIHYGADRGAAFFWSEKSAPLEFAVLDYSQDVVAIDASPAPDENGNLSVCVWILLRAGDADASRLAAVAEALRAPPLATVDAKYIQIVTRAR